MTYTYTKKCQVRKCKNKAKWVLLEHNCYCSLHAIIINEWIKKGALEIIPLK